LVRVTGGKLTTDRRMAADTVDEVDAQRRKRRRCRTKRLRMLGADGYEAPPDTNEPSRHVHLAHRYGTEAALVEALVDDDPALGEPLVPGLPYLKAEAVHAVRRGMARTLGARGHGRRRGAPAAALCLRRRHGRPGDGRRSEPRLVAARDDLGARRTGRGARRRGGTARNDR